VSSIERSAILADNAKDRDLNRDRMRAGMSRAEECEVYGFVVGQSLFIFVAWWMKFLRSWGGSGRRKDNMQRRGSRAAD
jgi:hypothetical protein